MNRSEFPDIDIDQLLDATPTLDDGFLAPFKQIMVPKVSARTREKRSRLAERLAQGDELIRQVKQLQVQNKQLAELQRTAQEVTDLYQKEKQQRLELQRETRHLGERCAELEKQLDAQVVICENLQEKLDTHSLPVEAKEVLGLLLHLEQRLGDDAGLMRREQNILKKLKDHCKSANITVPTRDSSTTSRHKRRSQATQTDVEPLPEKPTLCTVAVQVENLIQTRDKGIQHKTNTTTRGTTTASFIKKHDVGTSFPEPKPLPNVRQILDEMLAWRDVPMRPLSPLCELRPEMLPTTVSVATCTTLCNIHREIDFVSELLPQIKVSASRPPSRAMFEGIKEEARSSRELAKELLNFLPQNQSCLANLPSQAFEELWQVFGQMVLGLLQRRSHPPSVSQADFTSWLYELYEGTQGQQEQVEVSASKKDFSGNTDCIDVGTDPIIASPNISHGGDVTPIRLPPKPKERRHKSKKRKAAASLIKPIAKRKCRKREPAEDHRELGEDNEQEPETAIQFLSNLNTFNMANCDNLDMELDEEEMYLLQLTSKAHELKQTKESECQVQEESESSLKDDQELEHMENIENPEHSEGKTCQEAEEKPEKLEKLPSLPDLSLEETVASDFSLIKCLELENKARPKEGIPSLPDLLPEVTKPAETSLSRAGINQDLKTGEKVNIINLPEVPPTPLDTFFEDSDSPKESNQCQEQTLPAFTPEPADKYLYSSDSDSEDFPLQNVKETLLKCNSYKSNKSQEDARSINYLFGSDSESEASEQQQPEEDKELVFVETEEEVSESESEACQQRLLVEENEWSPIESEDESNVSESDASDQNPPKEDTELEEESSESESAFSKQQLLKMETKGSPISSEEDGCNDIESEEEDCKKLLSNNTESDSPNNLLSQEESELEEIDSDEELLEINASFEGFEEPEAQEPNSPNGKTSKASKDKLDEREKQLNKEMPLESKITDLFVVENPVPSFPHFNGDLNPNSENKKLLFYTPMCSPTPSSSDSSEEDNTLIIDIKMSPSTACEESPPPVAAKRRRTLSEIKTPNTPGEGRLTRQRAKQLLLEHNPSTESRVPLVEQIRRQLKQATNKSEPMKRVCNLAPLKSVQQKRKNPEKPQPEQSYSYNEESPASPCSIEESIEESLDSITEIPLEQADGLQEDGQPKSIIQHVIDRYKEDPKLSQLRRKTLGKSQPKLCAAIGKYLEDNLELEALSLEVYQLTKDEAVIVNGIVVVITKMGIEGNPLERLLSALKYFDFTQRFLAELEERLFRNTKERPNTELTMKYVKLYLAAVSHKASLTPGYTNPARLLLAKLLYHYEQDMPEAVLAVLRQFPTVLPHREERQYDHSDPLITVIKHLLLSRTYDMQDPNGAERLLLSKLRFEYHYQPFEPNKQQVLENLVEKLKAGRSLEQLGYAFALFCRRSPHIKGADLLVAEHLMPLATSYCDLAAVPEEEAYDERLVVLLQSISMVLKPLSLDTDISAFVGLLKRLIVAVPRPRVQQAAVQACLRLQRFGFHTIRDALNNYRPNYPLDPLTRTMLRCFTERRKQYHILAVKGKKGKMART